MNDILQKLTPGEITVLVSVIGIGGVVVGAVIGAGSSLLVSHLTRRSEERRHYRQLGVEIGRAKFDQSLKLAQQLSDASGKVVPVPPLDAHLIHGIRLMEIISDSSLSAEQIGERIAALTYFTKTVTNTVQSKQ